MKSCNKIYNCCDPLVDILVARLLTCQPDNNLVVDAPTRSAKGVSE